MCFCITKVGGPQISSAYLRANLLDLWTCRKCGTLRICDLRTQSFFVICRLTSASPQIHIFSPYKYWTECSNSNLYKINQLLGLLWDRVVHYFGGICEFVINRLIIKIYGFAICGLATVRYLRICESGMSPRICGFAICLPTAAAL